MIGVGAHWALSVWMIVLLRGFLDEQNYENTDFIASLLMKKIQCLSRIGWF
jgi:hypothetical protein